MSVLNTARHVVILLLAGFVAYFSFSNGISLFAWHPPLMLIGVSYYHFHRPIVLLITLKMSLFSSSS